jgi:prepilin-type N-terminal cleavage/methylation domain-containing protein
MDIRNKITVNQKAFTLVEILVVIAVIGLLSSIIFAITRGADEQGRIARGLYFSQHLQNSLGSYAAGIWNFDEGSGSTANDISGWGNNGTISGATYTSDTPSETGYALSFNGTTDYTDAGSDASTNFTSENFTISVWIKTAKGTGQTIVQRGTSQVRGYTLMADPYIHLLTHQSGTYTYCRSQNRVDNNLWQHWAAVREGTNVRLYYNGTESKPYTGGNCIAIANPITAPTDPLWIGRGSWGYFNGLADEVHIYSTALTATQIQSQYYAGLERLLTKGQITEQEYQQRLVKT